MLANVPTATMETSWLNQYETVPLASGVRVVFVSVEGSADRIERQVVAITNQCLSLLREYAERHRDTVMREETRFKDVFYSSESMLKNKFLKIREHASPHHREGIIKKNVSAIHAQAISYDEFHVDPESITNYPQAEIVATIHVTRENFFSKDGSWAIFVDRACFEPHHDPHCTTSVTNAEKLPSELLSLIHENTIGPHAFVRSKLFEVLYRHNRDLYQQLIEKHNIAPKLKDGFFTPHALECQWEELESSLREDAFFCAMDHFEQAGLPEGDEEIAPYTQEQLKMIAEFEKDRSESE